MAEAKYSFLGIDLDDLESAKPRAKAKPVKHRKTPKDTILDVGHAIHQGLAELFHDEMCTDFEIVVGNKTFYCHKVVLAAVSDYFRAMFSSGMKETVQNQATFEDQSPRVFELIFQVIYPDFDNGNDNIGCEELFAKASEEEMSELLRVAEMLQIKFLLEKCIDHFQKTVSPTNCIERWKMAKEIMNTRLSLFAFNFLLKNFEQVVAANMLSSLEFNDFYEVVKDKNIYVEKEEIVWKSIQDWIKFDEANREAHLAELMKECCLTELEEDTLIEELAFDPLVHKNGDATALVKNAIQYIRHPAVQGSMDIKLRENMDKERMLFLLCKKKLDGESAKKGSITSKDIQTIVMSSMQRKLVTVRPLQDMRNGLAITVHGMSLYASCGQKLLKYKVKDDDWEELAKMLVSLREHAMCGNDNNLFVIGGMSAFSVSAKVLRYNIEDDSWGIDGEVLVPVHCASAVCIRNRIYLFGGKMEGGQLVDSVQEYDTRNHSSTILCHLPKPCAFSRAVPTIDGAYIVTSVGEVILFSASKQKLDVIAQIKDFRRVDFGIEMRDDTIFVHGGRVPAQVGAEGKDVNDDLLTSVSADFTKLEEYVSTSVTVNVTSGEIGTSKTFPFPMQVLGCASVIMSPTSLFAKRKL